MPRRFAASLVILVSIVMVAGCSSSAEPRSYRQVTTTTLFTPATPVAYQTSEDLCEVFSEAEILEIVEQAYRVEGAVYPMPKVLEALPSGIGDGILCEWTVPGTPPGWGRPDFTVSFNDHSDVRLFADQDGETAAGATHLEDYHTVGGYFSDIAEAYDVVDLVPPGIVFLGGWSPGFDVYVESVDRIINFRHDLAAGAEWPPGVFEDYGVELRILILMLERMRWLPNE